MDFNGNLIVAPDRDRAIYAGLRKKVNAINPQSIITPSYIRMEQQLVSGRGEYDFNIQKNVGNPSATERLLDMNDAFVASRIGIYLFMYDPAKPGIGVLQTYPNSVVFADVAGEVDHTHLEAFYNGYLSVKVGDTVQAESMATRKFRLVRTSQKSAADNQSEAYAYDGLIELTPQFVFQGTGKNQLTLKIPSFAGQQVQETTATTRIKVAWYMEGFLITGGSSLGLLNNNK